MSSMMSENMIMRGCDHKVRREACSRWYQWGPFVIFDKEIFLYMYINDRIIGQIWKFWLKLYYWNFILLLTFLIKSTISKFNMTDEVKKLRRSV